MSTEVTGPVGAAAQIAPRFEAHPLVGVGRGTSAICPSRNSRAAATVLGAAVPLARATDRHVVSIEATGPVGAAAQTAPRSVARPLVGVGRGTSAIYPSRAPRAAATAPDAAVPLARATDLRRAVGTDVVGAIEAPASAAPWRDVRSPTNVGSGNPATDLSRDPCAAADAVHDIAVAQPTQPIGGTP